MTNDLTPTTAAHRDTTEAVPADAGPWRTRFTIIREHARGGLGRVSLANDESLGRPVALKEILPERRGDPVARQRFLNEAEITGQLGHPGIVPVYALEKDDLGQPYYAMRFVEGRTLRDAIAAYHAKPSKLAFTDLLRRFVAVCQTVAFVHARGVIHRDLKPANVLLGDYGETLVIDWGLARRVSDPPSPEDTAPAEAATIDHMPPETDDTRLTRTGTVLGTPAYMPPEQASGEWRLVGPASDVYSLGATLYEMLTGQPPYQGQTGPEIAARVRLGPPPLPRHIRPGVPRALEAVCLKAMARDPARRYATAAELAGDVERWLADEPVTAYREPLTARAWRWVRRHPSLVGVVSVLLLLTLPLAAALVVVSNQARQRADADRDRIAREEEKAQRLAERRQKVSAFYEKHVLKAPRPKGWGEGREVTLKEALDRAAEQIGPALGDSPEDEAQVCQTLGETYAQLGERARAEKLLRRAFTLRRKLLGEEARDTLESANKLGSVLLEEAKYAEGAELLQTYGAVARRVLGEEDRLSLKFAHLLAMVLCSLNRYAEAEPLIRDTADLRRRLFGPEDEDTLESYHLLAHSLFQRNRLGEARAILNEHLPVAQDVLGEEHPTTLYYKHNLAAALMRRDPATAEKMVRAVVAARRKVMGLEHPDTLASVDLLVAALVVRNTGYPEAEKLCKEALPAAERVLGPAHPQTLNLLRNQAAVYCSQNKHDELLPIVRQLTERGWHDDALILLRTMRSVQILALPRNPARDLETRALLAWALLQTGKKAEAERDLRSCLADARKRLPAGHWVIAEAECLLGGCLAAQQKYADAEPLLLSGCTGLQEAKGTPPERLRAARDLVVRLYTAWGKPDKAEEWKKRAPQSK